MPEKRNLSALPLYPTFTVVEDWDDLPALLADGWEPFQVHDEKVYLRRKEASDVREES